MGRSNYDKPFYVDVGTSIVAVRCASNHDVVLEYDHARMPYAIELAEKACDRMNREAEIGRPRRNCDVYTADELKTILKSELVSQLQMANEHEKNLVTITATGVIDTLFATTQKGGNDAD